MGGMVKRLEEYELVAAADRRGQAGRPVHAPRGAPSPAEGPRDQMTKALGGKMMAAERTRPDVLQIAHALQRRALAEDKELHEHLDKYIS